MLVCVALALPVAAQVYPGQYPRGPYPPGQSPGGGGIPWPRRGKSSQKTESEALKRYAGTLRRIDEKTALVEADDSRMIEFSLVAKTKFYKDTAKSAEMKPAELKPGDRLSVEAQENDEGYLSAVNVYLEKAAEKAADKAPEKAESPQGAAGAELPPAPPDPNDPGPPTLRRGHARPAAPEKDEPETETAAVAATAPAAQPPPEAPPADLTIEKARAATESFAEKLPNYVCNEYMARFLSSTHPPDWRAQDVVSTEVAYVNGREEYRKVAVNGRPTTKNIEQVGGAWSTGEFGTTLRDLFSPSTAAEFHVRRDTTINGLQARIYDFAVEREHSHWRVIVASQSVFPAYRGSVWIDPKTGRTLRIEMQARKVPEEFPLDAIESAVDYDFVRLGEGKFLLPVHAENLACERGTPDCSRNAIDFRNYHKYGSESTITFGSEAQKDK
jgi:hypothetical protein